MAEFQTNFKPPRETAAQRQARRRDRHGWHTAPKVCEHCGKPLQSASTGRVRRFCDWRCQRSSKKHSCSSCGLMTPRAGACHNCARKAKHRSKRICPSCGVVFWPNCRAYGAKSKYCGNACRLKSENARAFKVFECGTCGASFKRRVCYTKRVTKGHYFCSRQCSQAFFKDDRSPLFRGDKDPNRGAQWNRLAESIRERDGHKCRRCGKTQADNGQRLSVDHVRAWREFADKADANRPSNLVALCRPCHSFKTTVTERKWLAKGDLVTLNQFRVSCGIEAHQ